MLLREYIRLVSEAPANTIGGREPFELQQPVRKAPPQEAALMAGIYREFPLVVTPWVKQAMNITDDETEPDGTCNVEHEVLVDYDAPGGRVRAWMPYALNGAKLERDDAARLKQYLGDLTDRERDVIYDAEAEKAY